VHQDSRRGLAHASCYRK